MATLWESGTAGLIEEPERIRAFFESLDCANAAAQALQDIVIESRQEAPLACQAVQPDCWDPILVGNRFFITSALDPAQTPPGRLALAVNAHTGFGSGRHESTQLMLKALERYLRPGMRVLDVGCGSGILAMAARLLGACKVFACDIDPNSTSIARQISGIEIFLGSADAVRSASVDLVLANISARIVDTLAPDLNRVAKPDGRIIIAGFLGSQSPDRFQAEDILEDSDWECWICAWNPILAQQRSTFGSHPLQWW